MNLARQVLPGKGGQRYGVPEGRLKAPHESFVRDRLYGTARTRKSSCIFVVPLQGGHTCCYFIFQGVALR